MEYSLEWSRDLPYTTMNWNEAVAAAKELKDGWRLPTVKEAKAVYSGDHLEGVFKIQEFYWTADEYAEGGMAYGFFYFSERSWPVDKNSRHHVRFVREKNEKEK